MTVLSVVDGAEEGSSHPSVDGSGCELQTSCELLGRFEMQAVRGEGVMDGLSPHLHFPRLAGEVHLDGLADVLDADKDSQDGHAGHWAFGLVRLEGPSEGADQVRQDGPGDLTELGRHGHKYVVHVPKDWKAYPPQDGPYG